MRKDKDYYLLEALRKELSEREKYWQSQKKKEEELLKELNKLTLYILDVARDGKIHKIRLRDQILSLEESCQSLEEEAVSEAQRRANRSVNSISIKMCHLPFLGDNTEEKEQQLIFSLVVRKTTEKLMEFIVKMEQESERVNVQLEEWQKSRAETSEDISESRQAMVMMHFINEFEDHIMRRLTEADSAYSRLEYVRKQSKLQGFMAKSYLLGTSHLYINLQDSYWSVTGREQRNIGETLIPMLKHLIRIMEENKTCLLSSDTQAPVSGYSSRSTLKASAANSDNFQVSPSTADKAKPSAHIPTNSTEIYHRHQEYLFRFLTEKQASELIHLESILLTEEISRIWNFYESYKIKSNVLTLMTEEKDTQLYGKDQELNMNNQWEKLLLELTDVHRSALKALQEKHREEVKSMGLNPDTVIPASYFSRDVKEAILQLALEMQSVYQQEFNDTSQGVSSTDATLFTFDKDSQHLLFQTLAAKFVRQELLLQINMYNILDAYSKIQSDNCLQEMQTILSKMNLKPCDGKSLAKEAANMIEKQHTEKIFIFLKKSYKEQQNQMSLNEMQAQLKEEHCALTEQLLQEKYSSSLQEMSKCLETRSHMDYAVCFVLSQRHFRQTVILLQEVFKTQKQDHEKLLRKCGEYDSSVVTGQEEILNLLNNKAEAKLLLMELQHVIKRIQLKERHLGEIASGLKEFCSDKT
ncbi:putative leucine-rich repeat-containing protein DDB_G0290503 [Dendropsophus ebraccatus]|uniref:putative leucine-rich repeat-containing protein DDB_G0290503 n=1 Tax=Dendropsophus ebraccatus TaxID=150705 RepID=UPI0038312970